MCSNYEPARIDNLAKYFGIEQINFAYKAETYPGHMAPILRKHHGQLECASAMFGLVPHWADIKLARQTYNARSETVAEKPSFRNAWRKQQFCLIPLESFYEPNYESGKAVRWQISASNQQPLAVAGIWEWRPAKVDGQGELLSFSMLTINADQHPLMQRFHKPEDEKRMLVIVPPEQYPLWLDADLSQAQAMLQPWPAGHLQARLAPRSMASNSRTKAAADPAATAQQQLMLEP